MNRLLDGWHEIRVRRALYIIKERNVLFAVEGEVLRSTAAVALKYLVHPFDSEAWEVDERVLVAAEPKLLGSGRRLTAIRFAASVGQ